MAAVEAVGLCKRYGEVTAVDHLDLEIETGEIFGLLGPNGAGKTTTILMLLGLTEPTSGEARVDGLDATRAPLEVKRRVGYLPDDVGFYGDLTGRDNLRYTAELNRLPSAVAQARIDALLRRRGFGRRRGSAGRRVLAGHAPTPRARRCAREAARPCSSSTSRRSTSTPRVCARSSSSCAGCANGRARPCSSRRTCSIRSSRSAIESGSSCRAGSPPSARSTSSSPRRKVATPLDIELDGEGDPRAVLEHIEGVTAVEPSLGGWMVRSDRDLRTPVVDACRDGGFHDQPTGQRHHRSRRGVPHATSEALMATITADTRRSPRRPMSSRVDGGSSLARSSATISDRRDSSSCCCSSLWRGSQRCTPRAEASATRRSARLTSRRSSSTSSRCRPIASRRSSSCIGLIGPLLGIVFGFDAVNGERAQRTLPTSRLAADPPRRRDQRQVRGRHRCRGSRADRRRCDGLWLRDGAPRHHAGAERHRAARRLPHRRDRLHQRVVRARDAAVDRDPAGGDCCAGHRRGLARVRPVHGSDRRASRPTRCIPSTTTRTSARCSATRGRSSTCAACRPTSSIRRPPRCC